MKIIYRISDGGYNKEKPYYVTKEGVFSHFLTIFAGYDIYVVADNVQDKTYKFLCEKIDSKKIIRTSLSNAGAFMYAVQYALDNFADSDSVYFAEDDYIYKKNAPMVIEEGLEIGDYVSGYDHPDKYIDHATGGPNPFISGGGEVTRVMISQSCHWKITNSACMTFAAKVGRCREDLEVFKKYCSTKHPYDFQMFCELGREKKRKIISCMPSVSTHGETMWLAKLVDWEKEFILSI